ncbi:MAG: hypothetical protein GY906_07385 [bacterium]|nr:hypothetical protein [bacterium]
MSRSRTFVVFKMKSFPPPPKITVLRTEDQSARSTIRWLERPLWTSLRLVGGPAVMGFHRAEVVHRQPLEIEGRVQDLERIGLVVERRFPAYFSRQRKLFLAHADKDLARAAVRSLNRNLPKYDEGGLVLRDQLFELKGLYDYARVVTKVWLYPVGGSGRVNSQAFNGDDLKQSERFVNRLADSRLGNLAAEFECNGASIRASVSLSGTVFFSEQIHVRDCLEFISWATAVSDRAEKRRLREDTSPKPGSEDFEGPTEVPGKNDLEDTPVADAGGDRTICFGEPVVLDGRSSWSSSGELEYLWRDEANKELGREALVVLDEVPEGRHRYELTVTDRSSKGVDSDQCTVTVEKCEPRPDPEKPDDDDETPPSRPDNGDPKTPEGDGNKGTADSDEDPPAHDPSSEDPPGEEPPEDDPKNDDDDPTHEDDNGGNGSEGDRPGDSDFDDDFDFDPWDWWPPSDDDPEERQPTEGGSG